MYHRIFESNFWLLKPLLLFFSFIYKLFSFFHWHLKKIKKFIFSEYYLLSIDNLAFGGTGKTPAVIYIARELLRKGLQPAIVSRGYRSQKLHQPIKVRIDDNFQLVGDEPLLIKRNLPEVEVVVYPDRKKAIQFLNPEKCQVVILDDGFGSSYLKKDYSLLLINPEQPFYYYRYFLWMQKKANRVVRYSTKANSADPEYSFELEGFYNASGEKVNLQSETVVIFSALGDNLRFQHSMQVLKVVQSFSFPDHHRFSRKDLQTIVAAQINLKAKYIVCSEKDWIKVEGLLENDQKLAFIYVKNKIKFNFPLIEEIVADVKNKRKMEKAD